MAAEERRPENHQAENHQPGDHRAEDYRAGAALMLLNARREAFIAQRIDNPGPAWQMPQGGLEKGETARDGALRELWEETSIRPERVALLAELPGARRIGQLGACSGPPCWADTKNPLPRGRGFEHFS